MVQCRVADEKLIRLENFQQFCRRRSLTPAVLARDFENRVSYWSELLAGKKPFGEKIARRIEEKYGLARGQLDELPSSERPSVAAMPLPPMPAAAGSHGLQAVSDALAGLPPGDRSIAMAALSAWVQQGCPAESVPRLEALLGEFLPLAQERGLKVSNGA